MIKFVYFDVGGVVIKDFSGTTNWEKLMDELSIPVDRREEFDQLWHNFEGGLSIGNDINNILPVLQKQFNTRLSPGYSLLVDGFVNRFEKNPHIYPVIDNISSKVGVGLLTNMYPGMLQAIKTRNLLPEINWRSIVDSSIVKVKKPDPEIFRLARDMAGVDHSEILFVENTQKHIDAASQMGWQTFLYNPVHPQISAEDLYEFILMNI